LRSAGAGRDRGGCAESEGCTGRSGTDPPSDAAGFEARIEELTRLDEVWRAFVGLAQACGVRRIAYHHLPPPAAADAGLVRIENQGFGSALLRQYLEARLAGVAALANLIQRTTRPVYLDELEGLVALTDRERANVAGYRAAGVGNGLGLQVFGPNGRNGILAADLGERPRLAREGLAALRWGAQAMHLRYCTLLLPTLGGLPELTAREVEVLTWVARGKSNSAIADILGISAHTVDAHLRRIYFKLGVYDRVSAALRALGLGLISLER
jgi:DNA-binding CsgD family transcriptional regulator